jgi:NAD(P)H-binding
MRKSAAVHGQDRPDAAGGSADRPFSSLGSCKRIAVADRDRARTEWPAGFGAGDSRGRGGLLYNAAPCLFLGRVYADKDLQERVIRRSRLDWTIVRPTILTNGPRTGAYRVLVDPRDWTSGCISRARYEKTDTCFAAMINLVAAVLWTR